MKSTYAGDLTFNASSLVVDEITLLGSRCGPFAPALQLLAEGKIDPRPMIHARYPLSDVNAAFAHAEQPWRPQGASNALTYSSAASISSSEKTRTPILPQRLRGNPLTRNRVLAECAVVDGRAAARRTPSLQDRHSHLMLRRLPVTARAPVSNSRVTSRPSIVTHPPRSVVHDLRRRTRRPEAAEHLGTDRNDAPFVDPPLHTDGSTSCPARRAALQRRGGTN